MLGIAASTGPWDSKRQDRPSQATSLRERSLVHMPITVAQVFVLLGSSEVAYFPRRFCSLEGVRPSGVPATASKLSTRHLLKFAALSAAHPRELLPLTASIPVPASEAIANTDENRDRVTCDLA